MNMIIVISIIFMVISSLDAFYFFPLPKMIVFDVDNTLWPSWNLNRIFPPFRKIHTKVFDNQGKLVKPFPETNQVLKFLWECNIPVGVASRTSRGKDVSQLIELFEWDQFIHFKQLYTDVKSNHLKKISKKCDVSLQHILYFDNDPVGVKVVEGLGIESILLKNGINMEYLEKGLIKFISKKSPDRCHRNFIKRIIRTYKENYV